MPWTATSCCTRARAQPARFAGRHDRDPVLPARRSDSRRAPHTIDRLEIPVMRRSRANSKGPAERARIYVRAQLKHRGWSVTEVVEDRVTYLEAARAPSRRIRVRVKARTKGTWQATVTSGREASRPPAIPTFWAFVDLATVPFAVYVAPDAWVRRDIHRAHAEYLRRHGGRRARNDASNHHAIATSRVERWRDNWASES